MLSHKSPVATRISRSRSVSVKAAAAPPSTKVGGKSGVIHGTELIELFAHAQQKGYAIPAVNCTSSSIINSCMEAAKEVNSPMIIQFSNGGGASIAGKAVSNKNEQASIAGSIAGALHVRSLAKYYGVPIILHTDHCHKKILPWVDGLMTANEDYFKSNGEPLFSSHMLSLRGAHSRKPRDLPGLPQAHEQDGNHA